MFQSDRNKLLLAKQNIELAREKAEAAEKGGPPLDPATVRIYLEQIEHWIDRAMGLK